MSQATAISFEKLLTQSTGFDLPASPLQRAIARVADGIAVGDALGDEAIKEHFGCERSKLGIVAPVIVVIVAGVRGGKSFLAACAAVKGCLSADLSKLKQHEIPRFAIVAPTVDNATATFRILAGAVTASPKLRKLVVGEPTADTMMLRRPDGRVVEIVVVAASRGAVTLRSRWLIGFVLDEVALFGSEPTGAVVNSEELLRGAETRLVPGAQGWLISSPFGPQGLLHQLYKTHFGDPGRILVVHAPTRAMNPSFPAEQVEAIRARQPDVAAREYDAAWVDAETSLLIEALIERATRAAPRILPPSSSCLYRAAMDPALRGNAWTLAVATRTSDRRRRIVLCHEWRGSRIKPLNPSEVFREMRALLTPYGIRSVVSDQHSGDALAELARQNGLTLILEPWTQASKALAFENLKNMLLDDELELPSDEQVKADLLGIRRVLSRNGAVTYALATTGNGRHSDYAPSIAMVSQLVKSVAKIAKPELSTDEKNAAEKKRFLGDREKAKRWEERFGRAPVTHRKLRGRGSVRGPRLQ
jgi:hypothetical protein